jgi:hypothetical protein
LLQRIKLIQRVLFDKKVLLGVGIGIIAATSLMMSNYNQPNISRGEIEQKARSYGMEYPDESRVLSE